MPVDNLINPIGAFGYTANAGIGSTGGLVLNYVSNESSTTIAAGDCVELTSTTSAIGKIIKSTTAAGVRVLGVATESIPAGTVGPVQVYGLALSAACESAVAAGDLLAASTTTAGRLQTLALATTNYAKVIGVAMTAASSNTCTVYLTRS